MDRDHFDALARVLATKESRRGALGALLTTILLGRSADPLAARKKGKNSGKGRGGQRNRQKKRRRDTDQNDNGSPSGSCCGTRTCSAPKPGSNRVGCDFAGLSLGGGDYHGSTLRQIDGRGTNFDNADLHGATFGEACLQRASFRGANLRGTTWGGACLVDADFTGAALGEPTTFGDAIFCRTTLPDGSVNDRDCGTANRCCQSCRAIGEGCQSGDDAPCCAGAECTNGECVAIGGPGRCPVEVCQLGFPNQQGICNYVNSPNNQIGPACTANNRFCCNGDCCRQGDLCLASGCCTPEPNPCQGRCGAFTDNCGRQQQCGACPPFICQTVTCNAQTHVCDYVVQANRSPCTTASGQTGICCSGACVAGAQCCATGDCPQDEPCQPNLCQSNRCVRVTEPDRTPCAPGDNGLPGICCGGFCLGGARCCATSDCSDQTCREKLCSDNICQYRNLPNGQQGPNCTATGAFCCGQDSLAPATCCASGQTCAGTTCSGP